MPASRAEEHNWAGSHTYRGRVVRPRSIEELQSLVAAHDRVRALGTRHSFTDLADTADGEGLLVSGEALPLDLEIDEQQSSVSVSGAATFAVLGERLHRRGWALATMASLPHISVAGAVATGTHGSGRDVRALSSMVRRLELVQADGELRRVGREEPDFAGSVVSLGALGVVTRVTLDLVPAFDLRQEVWLDLPWEAVTQDLDRVMSSGYSVSLFTTWSGATVPQVWVKGLAQAPSPDLHPARRSTSTVHMIAGMPSAAVTGQLGEVGPWHERLPHFRASSTPSSGAELQSEYLLPIEHAGAAIEGLRARAGLLAPLLQVSEVRTVAADDQWLSGAFGADAVALHFTWHPDWEGVHTLLPEVERLLLPLGGRPHWGKCFTATAADLGAAYPMLDSFRALRDRSDPDRKFTNPFLERFL